MDNQPSPTAVICLSKGKGGMEIDALKLADMLSDICEIVLICKKGSFIEQLYDDGTYSFICEPISFLNKSFSLSIMLNVRKIIDSYKIRNVIYFGASELKTLYFSFWRKDLNIIVRHGTIKKTPKQGWFHRVVYSCVRYHVAISKHLLENVKDIVPYNADVKFKIIYPSFYFPENKIRSSTINNRLRIIHIGRVVPGKGHRDAVLACRSLYDNGINFDLSFVGSLENEKYLGEIKSVIDDLPYKNEVQFVGYASNVGEYLMSSDIFLFPSYSEGFGNVFVEAVGYGLSIVTYDNTTFPEFMKMGFKYRMSTSGDVDAMSAELLDAAVNITSDRKQLNANAELAVELFGRQREMRDWRTILD